MLGGAAVTSVPPPVLIIRTRLRASDFRLLACHAVTLQSCRARPGQAVRIVGELLRENLEGDVTIQFRVASAIHLAHSAGANQAEDFVGAEARAGRDRRP